MRYKIEYSQNGSAWTVTDRSPFQPPIARPAATVCSANAPPAVKVASAWLLSGGHHHGLGMEDMGPDALFEDDLVRDALVEAGDRGVDLIQEHQAGLGTGHGDPVGGVAEQGPMLVVGHVDAGDLGRILLGQTDIHEPELQVGGELRRHRGLAAAGAAQDQDG